MAKSKIVVARDEFDDDPQLTTALREGALEGVEMVRQYMRTLDQKIEKAAKYGAVMVQSCCKHYGSQTNRQIVRLNTGIRERRVQRIVAKKQKRLSS